MVEPQRFAYPPVVGEERGRDSSQMLLFLHIPKASGLTLQHAVNRQYGLDRVLIVPHIDWSEPEVYRRYLEGGRLPGRGQRGFDPNAPAVRRLSEIGSDAVGDLAAVMGHFWYGLHEHVDRPARYFTIVRDPVERVLSGFYFYGERFGLQTTLEEYVESGRDFEIDNAQTRRLVGRLPDADVRFVECSETMLERAKRNLERFAVVGLSERFDESFVLMARTFGWRYPTYDVYNVSRTRPRGAEIPHPVRERLVERNRYDYDLYAFATDLFEEQLARARVDAATVRRFRRINFFYRFPREHRVIGPAIVAGARVAGRVVRPFRRARGVHDAV